MRLSASSSDVGHAKWREIISDFIPVVYLDGVEQNLCLMADEDEGVVTRMALNENGETFIEDDAVKTETLFGVVKIELNPRS